ncbi:fimbrial protein [Morganella morganii]|uniref:fimbrial protein n=1 Tax=Morganella morganii TaxID=582 RepID=UPI0018985318|nr:fimbrial protein [Morganella morganii]
MYLMNIFGKQGVLLFPGVISLFILLGIFTYSNAEIICDNCSMDIEFKGVYKEDTCAISINGASANETVTLPTIAYRTLSKSGDEAGETNFKVGLSNCPTDVDVYLFFKSVSDNLNPDTRNLKNRTEDRFAKNVELRLRDSMNNHIAIDDPASMLRYEISNTNPSVVKDFYVSYFAGNNAVSPGDVEAKSVLEVVYK